MKINTKILLLFLFGFTLQFSNLKAQADLTLTMTDFMNWQASVSNADNISNVPLAPIEKSKNNQAKVGLDTNGRILYCPDGMNNFGPYIDSASQFNLFNFTHWQYIDILTWFGGSASEPVLIPSKAWVDAAHKNGVKVIGTIFFAPVVYGGSQAQVQSFLQQDINGDYIASQKMIDIANYYHFDGWIFNCETSVNSATAAIFMDFLNKFDSTYTGECIWYDSMVSSGAISYQNRLDANNAYFFQHSTGIFTNYNWFNASTITGSANYATSLSGSPFDVYSGADMWPGRSAQTAFTNYTWIDQIYQSGIAKTSTAVFAMNFTFNYGPFSNFNNDPNDYANFYATENKIFSGLDQDPFTIDGTWKGLGNYTAVRTNILQLPFSTDFNTGHGLNYYDAGNILSAGPWHNMSHQSPLPSWTFYKNGLDIHYEFNDAYNGGSSLSINGFNAGYYIIPLYSTCIPVSANQLITDLTMKVTDYTAIDSVSFQLILKSNNQIVSTVFHPTQNNTWESSSNNSLNLLNADTIIGLKVRVHSNTSFSLLIGKMGLDNPATSGINDNFISTSSNLIYPNPSQGLVHFQNKENVNGELTIFDLQGKKIFSRNFLKNEQTEFQLPGWAVYLYEFKSGNSTKQGKIVIN